jgi:hypothetical protein
MPFDIRNDIYDTSPIQNEYVKLGQPSPLLGWPILVTPKMEGFTCSHNGENKEIFSLVPLKFDKYHSGAQVLKIWYLPFFADTTQYTMLDPRGANIMVTAPMTGCTFGVGTSTINGQTIVAHSNAFSVDDRGAQRRQQARDAKSTINLRGAEANLSRGGLKPKLWEPKHYRSNDNTEILLFGIYSDGKSGKFWRGGGEKWRFYQHILDTSNMMNKEVKTLGERIFRLK